MERAAAILNISIVLIICAKKSKLCNLSLDYSYSLFKTGIKLGKAVCTWRDTRLCVISVHLHKPAYRDCVDLVLRPMLTYAEACRQEHTYAMQAYDLLLRACIHRHSAVAEQRADSSGASGN